MAGVLELKHHVLNGRLAQAKLIASTFVFDEIVDEDGNTPMHWCAQGLQTELDKRDASDKETFVWLLKNGAPKNRQNNLGETPLLTACRLLVLDDGTRALDLIKEMLQLGCMDPNRGDSVGETPLMEAAAAGMVEVGRVLLEHHANPLSESKSGLTAAQLASESGNESFTKLLKSALAERAAREARQQKTHESTEAEKENVRERENILKEQTLFGQKMRPGLAKDKDKPGKPYPEFGTLHDID